MMDFHACSWTSVPGLSASGDDSLARHFDSLNDQAFAGVLAALERAEAATGPAPGSGSSLSCCYVRCCCHRLMRCRLGCSRQQAPSDCGAVAA